MSSKIINVLTSLIEENGNEEFLTLWNENKKEEIFEMIKKLEKKSVKPKKKKDDNAPKKNVSAWILFSKAERPKIKAEFPDMNPKEVMKELSNRWKIAKKDEEIMAEFAQQARKDKERYEEEKKDYVSPEVSEVSESEEEEAPKKGKKSKKTKKAKKVKAEGEPKKPKSAWLFFCEAERKKISKEENAPKGRDILTELGRRWKEVTDKKKKKFEKLAAEAKEQYVEDMKKFKAEKDDNDDLETEDETKEDSEIEFEEDN